jgi:hypothetical protein
MELKIEPASDDLYLRLLEWRYPPPYDFPEPLAVVG